jgi:cobalt-zinc-cadmium efflux system membrane fusion protein
MKQPPSVSRTTLVLGLALALTGCPRKSNPVTTPAAAPNDVFLTAEQVKQMKIATSAVDLQDVDDTVLASGKVAYDDQKVIHVFSPVTGKVVKVLGQLGNHVNKGDPLVIIESPDIALATSDVGKARADLIAAEHDFQRMKDLLALHAASQKDFETAADNYRKAKAEMERAELKARLFKQGDVVGQTYTLHSDMEGEIFMKSVSPGMEIAGQYSGSGAPVELFTIGEADKVWVLADVFELDIPRVKVGSKVVVNVVSWPDRGFEGKVDWISGALDPNTHATKVRCTFDNADRALKPEMFATVRVSVDVKKAIAIPRSSVLRLGEQTVVFLDRGDKDGKQRFERVPVTVDEGEGSKWLTVDHGLEKGDKIVTGGAILLSGML